jgi:Coenzyme PQQ synthesis protein D (PqqD)
VNRVNGSEATIAPNPRVVYRDLAGDEGGVLLHLDTGEYHGLNPIGSLIWHLLEQGGTVSTIVGELRGRLEAAPEALEEDVVQFVADLRQRDLIVE